MSSFLITLIAVFLFTINLNAAELTLVSALRMASSKNSELSSMKAQSTAESAAVKSEYWLDNPRVGIMKEELMTRMQQEMGPMTSWTISQEIKFPAKYFLLGDAQSARARAAEQAFLEKALDIRQKVIAGYFALYADQKELELLDAQKETVREIARVAEARRATGAVPQQDEMKAHVEQTKLESEVLIKKQEREEKLASLNTLLGKPPSEEVGFPKEDLLTPRLIVSIKDIRAKTFESSKAVGASQFLAEEASKRKKLAYLSYAPDFMISYRKPYGNSVPGAYSVGIDMTIPLWFFTKQTSEVQIASAKATEAESNLETVRRTTLAEIYSLTSKVETFEKLLKIYESALIPQATSTLNSSRSAYRAGRAQFFDLLDSERSLYGVRIDYFETLSKYVEALTQLEKVVGMKLSSLPFEDEI